MNCVFTHIGIVGTGAMGRGIAQMAAQAGAQVLLFDTAPDAANKAREALHTTWGKLLEKGRLTPELLQQYSDRLLPCSSLDEFKVCDLVIEAVVEKLDVKQNLFKQLEQLVSASCVLATNTSSLSVTAIACALSQPERFAGYHFFNPVPLMKVVEVIPGLKTSAAVSAKLTELTRQMGHTPVMASDTPGFIVNHAGRGYGTEALRIVGEGVADFATIDTILKDQVGFKLGPFELMDLTGLDVSHPVMESVYRQYYDEPRYRPSVITAQRLAGGVLGRKTKAGFYDYSEEKQPIAGIESAQSATKFIAIDSAQWPPVWVSQNASRRMQLLELLHKLGAKIETGQSPSLHALTIAAPLGWDVTTVAVFERYDPARTVGIDMLIDDAVTKRRVIMGNPAVRADMLAAAAAIFGSDGKPVSTIRDSAGFVTQRVVAAIVNIASDMCQQQICTPQDLDTAVQLGLGYPTGPLAMGNGVGGASVLEVLVNMQTVYGDPRYRASPWLRRRGALGLSLLHVEA
ncbi:3-hydroxyacyl-CoA dehydrogenase [Variovorax sp. PCZ-1]|uniref:3-hydroxyacyl-CoA dehydrogenase n=1 Tax=Variovorax sp. PCZ-1 TaxID=2835533 RepID=UPI001BCCFCC4|nr:3-hydroxyacyl-CoA dehydrogenase [Variovorax sp. PCZ-1]MBS7807870.1 3-hydroxyacyl-CoA dehydrogenase [Variovorax sp. PCZ-1]